jgi:hypothetical protein
MPLLQFVSSRQADNARANHHDIEICAHKIIPKDRHPANA